MKKRCLILFVVSSFCMALIASINMPKGFAFCDSYDLDSILTNLDAIYTYKAPSSVEHFRDTVYVDIEKDIRSYLSTIKDSCDLDDIEDYLYDMMIEYSQYPYGEEDLIRYASIYLMCGYDAYAHVAYQVLANAYANLGDKDNLRHVLHCFEHSPINSEGDFDYTIADMRNQMHSVLYPIDMPTYSQGVWVSDLATHRQEYASFPYSIIKISSLTDDGLYALNLPSFDNTFIPSRKEWKDFRMAHSVEFDNPTFINNGRISAIFSSQHFQQGINTSAGFEQTRQLQAQMEGNIAVAKISVGEKIAATAVTTLTTGLFNWLLLELAQSTQTIATMSFNLEPLTPDVMSGNMRYIYHTFSTANPNQVAKPIFDSEIKYLRWLPEDSVFFVNNRGKILSITAPENLDLKEYERITKRWNQIRSYITLGTSVTGLGMMAGGIALACVKDNSSALLGGIMMAAFGEMIALVPPLILYNKNTSSKIYKQLNIQQLDKLRAKRQAATISFAPTLNPTDASAGIAVGVKY